jgi:RNA polymerase sigma-70 factor (ECF subfamily)
VRLSFSMSKVSGLANRAGAPVVRVVPTPLDADDDAALVAAVRAQAPRAPGRVWDRYASLSRRLLSRMLGPSAEVDDALQVVFLRLFRDFDTLREPGALRSFIIGITVHVATSELRRRQARRWLLLSDDGALPEPEPAGDTEALEQRQALLALYRVLDRVDTKRRLVFVLRYVEGLELAELSSVLGCSLATTKRRVADAAERVNLLSSRDPFLAAYVRARS